MQLTLRTALLLTLFGAAALASNRLELTSRRVELPEIGTVTNRAVATDFGTFSFMPPVGWSIEPNDERTRVAFVSPTFERITLRLADEIGTAPDNLTKTSLRQKLLARFPNLELHSQGTCYTEACQGTTFDIVIDPAKTGSLTRFAFVCVESATFEFTLTARSERFTHFLEALNALLTSFQKDKL
jgi:hypothetical protein